MRELTKKLQALLLRRRAEQDLDDELASHIEFETRKNVASGMALDEARQRAMAHFNGFERVKEECRDVRAVGWIETLARDVRYAIRSLGRSPGFTAAAVATITLGLGLNTAVFTLFNAYLLRPIAVPDPYSLHTISWMDRKEQSHRFTWQQWSDFRQSATSFSDVLGLTSLVARADGRPMYGQLVTGNHFQMLGVKMAAGRPLLPEDALQPGGEPVLVLSYRSWQGRFGGDPNILGRKVNLRGHSLQVVGVAGREFQGLGEVSLDFWSPITLSRLFETGPDLFGPQQPERVSVVGRLRPGVPVRAAESEVLAWAQRATANDSEPERAVVASVQPAATRVRLSREALAAVAPILVSFGLVLLIACANVANMTLSRSLARKREIGIRISLGASRYQLIRQLLVESFLLALPSAAAGLALSNYALKAGTELVVATVPADFADFVTFAPLQPDLRVFVFMLLAALLATLLFGLGPAFEATRTGSIHTVREQFSTERPSSRLRSGLVIAQIAFSVLLLSCAGLLFRGGRSLENLQPGFDVRGVIALETEDKVRSRIEAELETDARIEMVARAAQMPLDGPLRPVPLRLAESSQQVAVGYNAVSPEFFSLLRIPILEGRNFTQEEVSGGGGVAIVSRATASRLWPRGGAVGQTVAIAPEGGELPVYRSVQVVGVSADITHGWRGFGNDVSCLYVPAAAGGRYGLLIRSRGDASQTRRLLERDLNDRLPGALTQIHALASAANAQVYPIRAGYAISLAVGALALLLTLSGIYGVLSFLVAQRTNEIGIRIALGAGQGTVTAMVLRDILRLAGAGVSIGLLAALAASKLLSSVLILVNVFDIAAFCGSAAVVGAASLAAAYLPARRAGRMDPLSALRFD